MVTPPCKLLSIQPIWFWRGVQSPATGWTWLSIRPGATVVPLASTIGVDVLEAADRSDLAVLGDDGVTVQDRLFQGAGQDQADIPDHELRGSGGLGCVMRHGRGSLFLTATLAILGSLDPGSKQDYSLVHE